MGNDNPFIVFLLFLKLIGMAIKFNRVHLTIEHGFLVGQTHHLLDSQHVLIQFFLLLITDSN